jgi:MFS family permease
METSASGLGVFRALRHRNFRLFFGGQLVSLIGTWMQTVAQGWLVLKLSNSALMLGIVSAANYLPVMLVALFAGVVVDHVDRRRLIIGAQTLFMISALALFALTFTGKVRVEHVILLSALNGLVSSFDMPGRQAFIVEMVGREDLPNAIALNSMIFNGARTIGPAIAGLLIVVVGIAGCFLLNALSFLAVIGSLIAMDVPRRAMAAPFGSAMFQRLREGFNYVWRHLPSFYLLVLGALMSGFTIQYTVLIPVFARDLLHSGARGYGFLLGAQGMGAVMGAALLASASSDPRNLRRSLILGGLALSLSVAVFGLSPWFALSIAAQMANGFGQLQYMAATNTMLQLFVSDELRGRVMSFYTVSFLGLAPFGSLSVGFFGSHFGPRSATLICAAIGLACISLLATRMKMIAEAQAARAMV